MKAYHGDPAVKEKYLGRVREHRAMDQIRQKYGYWKNGKGCAVGCTIHGDNHMAYETELGVPVRLAYLEDTFFERLPVEAAREWPLKFLEAIPVGVDLSLVVDRFRLWNLVDPETGVIRHAKREQTRAAILTVAGLHERRLKGEKISQSEWNAAWNEAWSARAAAAAAAADADAAAAAAAADAADAADADAAAAAAAAAAADAWRWWLYRDTEVYKKSLVMRSEKLLSLLREAPVEESE